MVFETYWLCFIFFPTVNFLTLTYSLVLNGMYQEVSSFVGLSVDVQDVTKTTLHSKVSRFLLDIVSFLMFSLEFNLNCSC